MPLDGDVKLVHKLKSGYCVEIVASDWAFLNHHFRLPSTRRVLPRDQLGQGRKVMPAPEAFHRAREPPMRRFVDTGNGHQPSEIFVFPRPDADVRIKAGYPLRGRRHPCGQRLGHGRRPDRCNHAEPDKMITQEIDRLRALPHRQRAVGEQHCITLRRLRFHRDEPLWRTLCRVHGRSRFIAVMLKSSDDRFHVERRDQIALVT